VGGSGWLIEANKGKEMDFPVEPPERNAALILIHGHLDFNPLRPISDL
jgi:hypothetical protein